MRFTTISATLSLLTLASTAALKARDVDEATSDLFDDEVLKCGEQVYRRKDYTCYRDSVLCPKRGGDYAMLCGYAQCFFESEYWCLNGSFLCPKGALSRCGEACYNANISVCARASTSLVCPRASPEFCGNACYDPKKYGCRDDKLVEV